MHLQTKLLIKSNLIFHLNALSLPETTAGRDEGWQPASHETPRLSQMGQSSAIPNGDFLSLSNSSLVALHAECGADDLIGGERGNSGPDVDMMICC